MEMLNFGEEGFEVGMESREDFFENLDIKIVLFNFIFNINFWINFKSFFIFKEIKVILKFVYIYCDMFYRKVYK